MHIVNIFLHLDDLRVHDNPGLKKSSLESETIPLYVDDPRVRENTGDNKRKFRLEGLKKLDSEYRKHGSKLHYKQGRTREVVKEVVETHDIDQVFFNRSYTPLKVGIKKEVHSLDVLTRHLQDRLLVEPQELSKEYGTFSPFYREWKKKEKQASFEKPENLARKKDLGTEPSIDLEVSADLPTPGEKQALEKWRDFRDNRLENYKDKRDDVAEPRSVSRLSMYYSSGMLGLRKVVSDVEEIIEEEESSDKIRNYAKYRNELAWREFFYQVIWHNPRAVDQNYNDFDNRIEWRNSEEEFQAWKQGRTGVPFVDAGIRELRETGYMHNRTRQNVASFLTKHLMIDWRKGARFFKEQLLDHDVASNNGGWQWAASTGTDSVPIRIFNPVKQGRRYDTHAEYIKRWVPELRSIDPNSIHNWVEMKPEEREEHSVDYPEPIINFNQRYHMGKKMFENALGK